MNKFISLTLDKNGMAKTKGVVVFMVIILIVVACWICAYYYYSNQVYPNLSPVNGENCASSQGINGELLCLVRVASSEDDINYCASLEGDSREIGYFGVVNRAFVNISISAEDYCWINFAWKSGNFYCENVTEGNSRDICLGPKIGGFR